MTRLICWWLGHVDEDWIDHGGYYFDEYTECTRCGERVAFEDIAYASRYHIVKDWIIFFFWRKWVPEKCRYCGKRRCSNPIECLPF